MAYLARVVIGLLLLGGSFGSQVLAAPCDTPANEIVAENCLPGNPSSQWDVSGSGDPSIQGFATDISVDQGQTIAFKIATPSTSYRLDIYRMGYYGGMGARLVASVLPTATLPQSQPACLNQPSTGLNDCGNWAVSASWAVPANATSGIYFARLVRQDAAGASHVVFIVRDDDGGSDLLLQTSDTTWQAYNQYGGNSLYTGSPAGRAYKVSYNRPFTTRGGIPEDWVFNAEYPMVRWLEANGYDVSYFTGVDADRRGGELLEHRVYLSVGHDEYWSGTQRANVEAARAAGVALAFFSGNEVFWKTRWEASIDGSGTSHRTLVTYKETHANAVIDPSDPPTWTGTWRDPRFSPPADGGRPENALTGTIFTVNCCSYPMTVPEADGKMRFWRNTSIATLAPAQTATLPGDTLGYEWDEDLDNGFRPAGIVHLSSTTVSVPERILDHGSTYGPGTATHHLTLYRGAGGALVFGAGSVQWVWGLDSNHDRGSNPADVRMQQATVNLLADMLAQPATLQPGLVAATASTDVTPPTSTVGSPSGGSSVTSGVQVTITGTAADTGGRVGGVEVSVDGGATWHPATGRTTWSYLWTPGAPGSATIRTRAVDDSGRLETPSAGVTVTVEPRACPCTIWDDSIVPTEPSSNDPLAIEVGVKFRVDAPGLVTGLRFYKGSLNTGTHVGHLWTRTGTLLATATFTGETASGWQQVSLPTPVAISAGTTYVASYHTTSGNYAFDLGYFTTTGVDAPPLHALEDGVDGPNGVYRYGASAFPTDTFNASNYWVDVVVSVDNDGDTFLPPEDCDDTDPAIHPGATEVCDGDDNDCDGPVDEGLGSSTCGVGACQRTIANCLAGQPQTCTPGTPGTETCNGVDDDCDGQTDESLGATTCGVGACQRTVANCLAGQPQTCTPGAPGVETCNGIDDDCDGQTDEGLGTTTCGLGPCERTVANCLAGQPQTCVPGPPGTEICNGVDDDCDGTADDGLGATTCGLGPCQHTVPNCAGGQPQTCDPLAGATPEVCNAVDDDCDGAADDGDPGGGGTCDTGQPGVCAPGTRHCQSGTLACVPDRAPGPETCNGLDDDCDGAADEGNPGGGGSCSTGLPGACSAGTLQCQGGVLGCVATAATPEVCDGADNDCDGTTDDGNPGGGGSCATGLLGVCATGTQVCQGGALGCVAPAPTPERCTTGLDENCDGQVDEADCAVCAAATTIATSTQTKKTAIRGVGSAGTGRLKTGGVFHLAAPGTIAPTTQPLVLQVRDGTGQVRYQGTVPAGSLVAAGNGRVFRWNDRTAVHDGVRLAKLTVARDQTTVKYSVRAQALTLGAFAAGPGRVTLAIGDRCFTDTADTCVVPSSATTATCK